MSAERMGIYSSACVSVCTMHTCIVHTYCKLVQTKRFTHEQKCTKII